MKYKIVITKIEEKTVTVQVMHFRSTPDEIFEYLDDGIPVKTLREVYERLRADLEPTRIHSPNAHSAICPEAAEAAKKVPTEQIADAIRWTATYLETLQVRKMVSEPNAKGHPTAATNPSETNQ